MINTLDVTVSGCPDWEIKLPNGSYKIFHLEDGSCSSFWRPYKSPETKTINLVNIETFRSLTFPVVKINIKEKPVSWFTKFWYSNWDDDKIYDIDIKAVGIKTVTQVFMRSKDSFMIDESVECLKNAIDACVWTADIK